MMKSIIEALYCGGLDFSERINSYNSHERKKIQEKIEKEQYFKKILTYQEHERFDELEGLICEEQSFNDAESFARGFAVGLSLTQKTAKIIKKLFDPG